MVRGGVDVPLAPEGIERFPWLADMTDLADESDSSSESVYPCEQLPFELISSFEF